MIAVLALWGCAKTTAPVEVATKPPVAEVKEAAMPEVPKALFLTYRIQCARVDVALNGVPMLTADARAARRPEGGALDGQAPLNLFQISGENLIKVNAVADDDPACSDFRAEIRVARFGASETPSHEGGEQVGQVLKANVGNQITTVTLGESQRWSWQDAPVVPIDGTTRPEIDAFVTELHGALERRDKEALSALRAPLAADMVKAFPALSMLDNQAVFYGALAAKEPWAMAPLKLHRRDYKSVASGRLIHLVKADGSPMLHTADYNDRTGEGLAFPVVIQKVDGAFKIVR